MTYYGYIIVDLCIISFNLNCIMQLKQFYTIATKVSSRKKCYYFWWSTWLKRFKYRSIFVMKLCINVVFWAIANASSDSVRIALFLTPDMQQGWFEWQDLINLWQESINIVFIVLWNIQFKVHQIWKLKSLSSCLAVVFAQSIEARC